MRSPHGYPPGRRSSEALRNARPPIFFKHQDSVKRQLGRWSEAGCAPQLDRIAQAEIDMKTTGLPAETAVPPGDAGGGPGRPPRPLALRYTYKFIQAVMAVPVPAIHDRRHNVRRFPWIPVTRPGMTNVLSECA